MLEHDFALSVAKGWTHSAPTVNLYGRTEVVCSTLDSTNLALQL